MSNLRRLILFWVCFIVFIFAIFQASDIKAAEQASVFLDQNTIERGYTVKSQDDRFWMPVLPQVFSVPTLVTLGNDFDVSPIPSGYNAISDFYFYDIKSRESGFLQKPVLISLKYYSNSDENISLFYFNKTKQLWQELPTQIDTKNKLVQTRTIFPYLQLVVMQKVASEYMTMPESMIVTDKEGNILFAQNENLQRPLASLTKLVTASVFLDHNPGWEDYVTIVESDNVGGASLPVKAGDMISVKDLFFATLTASKNNAARALMRSTGLTEKQFVTEMNNKVKSWGLEKTVFVEPTGLSEYNVSTAKEMVQVSKEAFKVFKFLEATTIKNYEVKYISDNDVKTVWLQNTNKLLTKDLYITGGKTGYTEEAGYNLVTKVKGPSSELIALVLGANKGENFDDVYYLLKKFL